MKESLVPCLLECLDLSQLDGSGVRGSAKDPSLLLLSEGGKAQIRLRLHVRMSADCLLPVRFQLGLARTFVRIWSLWGEKPSPTGRKDLLFLCPCGQSMCALCLHAES